jgi:PAS domain S-box-containing protein
MWEKAGTKTEKQLLLENEELRLRLTEAEEALNAIRNGEVDAIVVSGTDGEKVFSLASAETPYRIIVEEMNEGAVSLSPDGTILYCNRRFAEIVSTPSEKIIGSDFIRFVAENDKPKYNNLLHTGFKERCRGEITCLIHNSNPVHFHLSFNPLPPGMLGDVCIMAADISELKQKEEELQYAHDTLEQQVTERTATLTATLEKLEASRIAALKMMGDAVEDKNTIELSNKKLFEEITERKQAEKQVRLLSRAVEQSPVTVIITDKEGNIEYVNSKFTELTGYTIDEIKGKNPRLLQSGEQTKSFGVQYYQARIGMVSFIIKRKMAILIGKALQFLLL